MSEVFTPTRYKWTVDDYHKLGDAGILTEDSRVELIAGDLIEMARIDGPHMGTVNRLNKMLVLAVGDHGVVSVQNPVTLPPYSEPQPDFAILRPGAGMPASGLPLADDVLLLIEVYRDPAADSYSSSAELWPGDFASPRALPMVKVDVAEIFR